MLLAIESSLVATIISSATMLTIVMSYFAYRIASMMVSHYCETSIRDQKYQMFKDNRPIITNFVDDCKSKLFSIGVYVMGFRSMMSLTKCFMRWKSNHPVQQTFPVVAPCPDAVRVTPFADFIRNKPINPFFDDGLCPKVAQMKPIYDFGKPCPETVQIKPVLVKNPFETVSHSEMMKNIPVDIQSPIDKLENQLKPCSTMWFDSEIKVECPGEIPQGEQKEPEPFDPSSEKWSPFPFNDEKASSLNAFPEKWSSFPFDDEIELKENAMGPVWGDLRGHPLNKPINPFDSNEFKPQKFNVFPKEIPVVQPARNLNVDNVQYRVPTGLYQPKRTHQNPNQDEPKKRNYDKKRNLKKSLNKVVKEMERGRDRRVSKMRRDVPPEEPKVSSFMDTIAQTLKSYSVIKPDSLTTVLNFLGFDGLTSLLPLLMGNNVNDIIGNFGGAIMKLANAYDAEDCVCSFVGTSKEEAIEKCKKICAELCDIDLNNFTNEDTVKKVGEMMLDKEKFATQFQFPNQKIADLIRLSYLIYVGPEKYAEDINKGK